MSVFLGMLGVIAFLGVSLVAALKLLSHAKQSQRLAEADLAATHDSMRALREVAHKQEADDAQVQQRIADRKYFD